MSLPRVNLSILNAASFRRTLTLAFVVITAILSLTVPVAFYAFSSIEQSAKHSESATHTLEQVIGLQKAIGDVNLKAQAFSENASSDNLAALAREIGRAHV